MWKTVGIFVLCFLAVAWADEREPSKCEEDRARRQNATIDDDVLLHLIPECDENGDYAAKQCFTESVWCVCYTRTGENIGAPSRNIKDCKCRREQHEAKAGGSGGYIPVCMRDGYYRPKQCLDKECWCVDKDGKMLTDPTTDINLKCE